MIRLAIKLASAITGIVVLYFAVTFVQVWLASRRDDRTPTQAIIVLGAAQYDGRPSPVLAARLDHAYVLWREGVADTIVVTGGGQEGDRFTEASAGAMYLHRLGVPDEVILRETTGHSSWESLAASARFLEDRGIERVTLVSDPFHAARIAAIAGELGFDAHVSPTPHSPVRGMQHVRRLGTEAVRVGIGRLVGYERLTRVERVGDLVPGLGRLPLVGGLLPASWRARRRRTRADYTASFLRG
jgi:uncharacterized SAM-binding protein YcdF (DUF218 family)